MQEEKTIKKSFNDWIKVGSDKYPPQKDRYHLYVSYACPFAHRAILARSIKGLQDVIGMTVVHPTMLKTRENEDHYGWAFSTDIQKNEFGYGEFPPLEAELDPINNYKFVRDIYEAQGPYGGTYSVPVLYDKETKSIVNNESAEIAQMLNSQFNEFAKHPEIDLEPENLKQSMEKVDPSLQQNIIIGVYKCGFAQAQEPYKQAFENVYMELEKLEFLLSKQRYLTGDQLTLSDIKLWAALVRFDEVYSIAYKINKKLIHQYENIMNYCRDIYSFPGVQETLKMEHIKVSYYGNKAKLNYYGIIPEGCGFENMLKEPHNREKLISK